MKASYRSPPPTVCLQGVYLAWSPDPGSNSNLLHSRPKSGANGAHTSENLISGFPDVRNMLPQGFQRGHLTKNLDPIKVKVPESIHFELKYFANSKMSLESLQ